tara:strand:- start:17 stop:373 length:357 start_codon:yes stop_codon:yes gene_type:complete
LGGIHGKKVTYQNSIIFLVNTTWAILTNVLDYRVVGQGKIKGMYKKIIMANLIEELTNLPVQTQEAVLKNLSEEMIPLEIDGDIFMIHKNVSSLIDNLVLQIGDLKIKKIINVRKKND